MSPSQQKRIFVGSFMHSNENGELITVEHGAIYVEQGKITDIVVNPGFEVLPQENVTILKDGHFMIPGFVDCHIHAVQTPNLGVGYDKKLLDWLEIYTFPLERKYTDEKFAKKVFNTVVRQTVNCGTTTACYFASLSSKASIILGLEALAIGQRALIGKLSMNEERSDNYYESTEESVRNIKKFVVDIANLNSPLLKPVVTPRFALSCDMTLMKELGKLAKEKNLHVQTHISENLEEIKAVKEKFPGSHSYADVYDKAGLLTNKTVLAHGVYLTDDEIMLLKKRDTSIVHCPSSNTCLKSGLCDVLRLREKGVTIGLGTDVAGGQSCSILDTMKQALQVSNCLSFMKENKKTLNYKDVLYLATLGGATALSLEKEIGNFAVGKDFDALVIDTSLGLLNDLLENTLEERLQKFVYSGDDRNIVEVYISGCKVK